MSTDPSHPFHPFVQALLWCTVINYILLILWFAILKCKHDWIYNLSTGPSVKVSREQFDTYNFLGIILFKSATILFFLVPYIALRIVGV